MTLSINTSQPEATIALIDSDTVWCERHFVADPMLGQQLLGHLDDMLVELGKTKQDIAAVTVDPGPGHFMALRTGITTARTLAQALGLSLPEVEPQYE
jgi:tRNA threonylcarbamoyladenosine biosynthesis protein TsaB